MKRSATAPRESDIYELHCSHVVSIMLENLDQNCLILNIRRLVGDLSRQNSQFIMV
ncbi:hypothetical protein BF49_2527 [Bradyrhizobium sp.]|nr:hypothetical protein BF49_2527 [Bradyrhizobium sp.]